MDKYRAAMIAEGVEEADEETQIEAWQTLIDTGLAWRLQGFFGRQAQAMIDAGLCSYPEPRECDACGKSAHVGPCETFAYHNATQDERF